MFKKLFKSDKENQEVKATKKVTTAKLSSKELGNVTGGTAVVVPTDPGHGQTTGRR